jgi:hypothetical protein
MENNLKEQILKFIEKEEFVNERLRNDSLSKDCLTLQFIAGKKAVLERLEALLQESS